MQATTVNRNGKKAGKVSANAEAKALLSRGIPGNEGMHIDLELAKTIISIDRFFGEGYAQKNPILVAAALQALAHLDNSYGNIEDALTSIGNGLCDVAASLKEKV